MSVLNPKFGSQTSVSWASYLRMFDIKFLAFYNPNKKTWNCIHSWCVADLDVQCKKCVWDWNGSVAPKHWWFYFSIPSNIFHFLILVVPNSIPRIWITHIWISHRGPWSDFLCVCVNILEQFFFLGEEKIWSFPSGSGCVEDQSK